MLLLNKLEFRFLLWLINLWNSQGTNYKVEVKLNKIYSRDLVEMCKSLLPCAINTENLKYIWKLSYFSKTKKVNEKINKSRNVYRIKIWLFRPTLLVIDPYFSILLKTTICWTKSLLKLLKLTKSFFFFKKWGNTNLLLGIILFSPNKSVIGLAS